MAVLVFPVGVLVIEAEIMGDIGFRHGWALFNSVFFFFMQMAHTSDFFPRKHLQHFSLKDRLFYGSVLLIIWEIIVARWYDQLAALGCWYLSLYIYLIFLISGCSVSVHYFFSSFFVLLL